MDGDSNRYVQAHLQLTKEHKIEITAWPTNIPADTIDKIIGHYSHFLRSNPIVLMTLLTYTDEVNIKWSGNRITLSGIFHLGKDLDLPHIINFLVRHLTGIVNVTA